MTPAEKLADWLRAQLRGQDVTHLKLQKLVFYAFGVAIAHDFEAEVGPLEFEAWEHGPVNRSVWEKFRTYRSAPIPPPGEEPPSYSKGLERALVHAVTVYGSLDAWSLRHQTHLEAPWVDAFKRRERVIDPAAVRTHFKAKYGGAVKPPEYLSHAWNFRIDRLPVASFTSFRALAEAVAQARR